MNLPKLQLVFYIPAYSKRYFLAIRPFLLHESNQTQSNVTDITFITSDIAMQCQKAAVLDTRGENCDEITR